MFSDGRLSHNCQSENITDPMVYNLFLPTLSEAEFNFHVSVSSLLQHMWHK